MILPYKTDAPVYHWPFATVGLILVNAIALPAYRPAPEKPPFTIEIHVEPGEADPERLEELIEEAMERKPDPPGRALHLTYGDGLHPHQWVTSSFLHAGFWHLLGNMAFLWVFGLVIEGKVGWYWFLLIYLGIGIIQNAVEQTIALGMEGGGSLGASSIIFGLLAMALVWAPQNEVRVFYWIFVRIGVADVTIKTMAILFIIWEGFWMVAGFLHGPFIGSSLLHLIGAAIGFPLAVFLLRRGWVDCEGWDLFSLRHGRPRGAKLYREDIPAPAAGEGSPEESVPRPLAEHDLRQQIQALQGARDWAAAKPLVLEYIRRFPQRAAAMKLLLAGIYLDQEKRPAKAAEVLGTLAGVRLPENLERARRGLIAKAERLRREGAIEVDLGD